METQNTAHKLGRYTRAKEFKQMFTLFDILLFAKYILSACLVLVILLAPSYLAVLNGKGDYDVLIVRLSSWLLGWTIVGWFFGLFWSIKK